MRVIQNWLSDKQNKCKNCELTGYKNSATKFTSKKKGGKTVITVLMCVMDITKTVFVKTHF